MSRIALRVFAFVAVAVVAAGCTMSFESKKIDYKSAGQLPPLEIPPDLTAPTRDDRYAVPDISPKGSATYSVYSAERGGQPRTTTASQVLPDVENIRVQRAGGQRWLVVAQPAEKLWPSIKDFWQEMGFIVNVERPDAGIMETDWAENRAKLPQDPIRRVLGKVLDQLYSTSEMDKFRTRLEPGVTPGTTEIYISHRGVEEVYSNQAKDQTMWQPRKPDGELEAEMLRRLMVRLGTDEERAKAMIAVEPRQERATLKRAGDGPGTLEVQDAFDRAWRRVGLALDRVGFTVEDRDRSQGIYFVRYVDPGVDAAGKKSEPGLMSKLMFWRSDKRSDDNPKGQYRIHVAGGAGDASAVRVLTREGGVDRSETATKILGLLYDQLK